mmetsp:Transcript_8073/g.9729  ORF Transcript_8073/g.9729 Transcript_8073/m.9729 type:complete len:110 (-) Transcript_8073:179-508(-)
MKNGEASFSCIQVSDTGESKRVFLRIVAPVGGAYNGDLVPMLEIRSGRSRMSKAAQRLNLTKAEMSVEATSEPNGVHIAQLPIVEPANDICLQVDSRNLLLATVAALLR